nr:septum formation family protein [Galbitalea soli]
MGVASALLAVLALVVLYIIGTQWGAASTQAATTGPSSSPTAAAPTPTPGTGPVAAGTHSWTELRGGECIQPFTSPWATSFRVVDCTADHDAQMIYRGTLPEASGAPYPAAGQLQTEITPMCSAPTVLDYAAAKSLTDAVVAVSYPATAADWNKGDRTFFCFITTASGGNLPSDLAMTAPTK